MSAAWHVKLLLLPFPAPVSTHTGPMFAGDCGKLSLPGKNRGPSVAIFCRLRAEPNQRLYEVGMSGCFLRLYCASRHLTVCCSLVRHRADSWQRDQKSRQRLPFSHFATVTLFAFAE